MARVYCCTMLADWSRLSCKHHTEAIDCPDVLIVYNDWNGYGLPIRDGGGSYVQISYCPFCGLDITQDASA